MVRAAKSRESQLRQEGMTGTRAGKAAIAAVAKVKTKKQKKKASPKKCAPNPDTSLCLFFASMTTSCLNCALYGTTRCSCNPCQC